MFQYAAGKALAQRHGVRLVLDLNGFRYQSERPFLLDRFSVPEAYCETISRKSPNYFIRGLWKQRIDRLLNGAGPPKFSMALGQYFEPHFHYDPKFELLGPNIALFGYFQSERYFNSIANNLRDCFSPRKPLSARTVETSGHIGACQLSVSVHVRRGDYLNPGTLETHGILGEAYYRKAIASIDFALGKNSCFFVFSDDLVAAEQLLGFLPGSRLHFVSGDADRPWEDMILMSRCQHHVIANSSFSWWGAWLSRSACKLIVAPRSWFARTINRDTTDLYPPGWILV
jgi:hypothetical protein